MSGEAHKEDNLEPAGEPGVDLDAGSPKSGPSTGLHKPRLAFLRFGLRTMLRGEISPGVAAREYFHRNRVSLIRRRERSMLAELGSQPSQLRPEFQKFLPADLLKHFRGRTTPSFLPGFASLAATAATQRKLFPTQTEKLIESAYLITRHHRWSLLGFDEMEFGEEIDWNRDPLSGRAWPLDFHADIPISHNDGSDIRVLWELNRLGHFITLGRAYAVTEDEVLAEEFFAQLATWQEQNPVARGANWSCAMEVALRAMNLLVAFNLFRLSPALDETQLALLLAILEQHAAHIQRNLEFSYVVTSNHYLSDIVGLLWLGIMLPELSAAEGWRRWAAAEMLREMDKQILPDGADWEASTGYHRFVLELFLYSFVLCKENGLAIEEKYWQKLHAMLDYVRDIVRPDGFASLIGDTDGGQVVPIVSRAADDHAYLPALGAAIFRDSKLKLPQSPPPEELLWILGERGIRDYTHLPAASQKIVSHAFRDAGTCVMRHDDLYLLLNASGSGSGPRAHGHNDALSIEVSACGRPLIVDPGAYVYTADLHERHLFRSTRYHSTVQIDEMEQNTINESVPFVNGAQARARVLEWETSPERDYVVAEHSGYERLNQPVRHRRKVTFEKTGRWWLVEDEFEGQGAHTFAVRFHFDAGLEVKITGENVVIASDQAIGVRLLVCPIGLQLVPRFEPQFVSRHYGSKLPSVSACWSIRANAPCQMRWGLVPVCASETEFARLQVARRLGNYSRESGNNRTRSLA